MIFLILYLRGSLTVPQDVTENNEGFSVSQIFLLIMQISMYIN